MNIVYFLLIGVAAGWLAGQFVKGGGFGLVGNMVLGVVGAVIGGVLFGMLGLTSAGLLGSLVSATVGAVLLLVVVRAARKG